MVSIKPVSAGFALAAFAVVWHAVWSALVAAGWAQPLLDLVFRLHFIAPPFRVGTFDLGTAGLLLVVTGLLGFAAGFALATIWNGLARRRG